MRLRHTWPFPCEGNQTCTQHVSVASHDKDVSSPIDGKNLEIKEKKETGGESRTMERHTGPQSFALLLETAVHCPLCDEKPVLHSIQEKVREMSKNAFENEKSTTMTY